MDLKNASVVLIFKILGSQLSYGKYEYRERTTSGNLLSEDRRLFVIEPRVLSDCHKQVNFSERFVNHAISEEGRPHRNENFKAHTFWRRFTQEQKLGYHIAKYVGDMYGEDYSFNIQEE